MNDLVLAYGLGAVSGARSMLGPALIAHAAPLTRLAGFGRLGPAVASPAGKRMALAMAVAELIADKSARLPARTGLLPLAGRMLTGAVSGAVAASSGRRARASIAGAVGALSAAYAFYHLRRFVTTRFGTPNAAAGLGEDIIAAAMGLLVLRAIERAARRDEGRIHDGPEDPLV